MHDPHTLAFDIYLGSKKKKNGHYRTPVVSIWHKDPELKGSDDSCGWFIRLNHIDPVIVEKVRKEFEFSFKQFYWFNSQGQPKFSTAAIALNMYNTAAWQVFMHLNKGMADRKKLYRFMRKHMYDILMFAENPTDSIFDAINNVYGNEKDSDGQRISYFVSVILTDIMRKLRPWYKHPRWHIHHWQIQVPLLQAYWRYYFQRCAICKKMGFHGRSAYGNWEGTKTWCESCNRTTQKQAPKP